MECLLLCWSLSLDLWADDCRSMLTVSSSDNLRAYSDMSGEHDDRDVDATSSSLSCFSCLIFMPHGPKLSSVEM